MKIQKIDTKLIKPQTPTPQHLKNYNISFLDKQIGGLNFAVILFYESKPEDDSQLEKSLAKILVQFYPLAGRYVKNDVLVDCSDQGVEFVRAEALDVELMDLVAKNLESSQLNGLLPDHYFRADNQLLSVQATHFPCGGVAIAISISHTVSDASSLATFIAAWSSATNPNRTIEFTPSFDLASLLPFKERNSGSGSNQPNLEGGEIVVKRLLFDKVTLTSLKSKLSSNNNGKTISRVRFACAVIAKAMIRLDRAKQGRSRGFVINQAINMRGRTIPPQSKHACGNFAIISLTKPVSASEAMELGVRELADLLGDAVEKSIADHVDMLSPSGDARNLIISNFNKFMEELMNPETNLMAFSDWSKFGFYEADFGWGKPVRASIGPFHPGIAVLMSNKEGDGIEALLPLDKNDVHYLELDEDIKSFMT